jgi:signal transduction histidine kinase/CheY-like chemotaxis protein
LLFLSEGYLFPADVLQPDLKGAETTMIAAVRVNQAMSADVFSGLLTQHVETAKRITPAMMVGHALILAALYYKYGEAAVLVWGALAQGVFVYRLWLLSRYRRPEDHQVALRWERRSFEVSAAAGVLYAIGTLFLIRRGEHLYNGIVVLWALAVISGAAGFAAFVRRRTVVFFCGSIALAMAARLIYLGGTEYWVVAGASLAYTLAQVGYGLKLHEVQAQWMEHSLLNAKLAKELEVQVARALDAGRRAEASHREKNRFIAAASHDLRQPLHALALSIESLSAGKLPSKNVRDLQVAQSALQVMGNSLDAMLELSRLEAGAVVPRCSAVGLADLFSVLNRTFLDRAEQKGLALRFHHRGISVQGDRDLLLRVLGNLVDNSLKFTKRGGVMVLARRRTASDGTTAIQIEVRDSGIGLSAEQQALVFDEYYQVPGVKAGGREGLGLGLSIIKRLTQLMGVSVELCSRIGHGTRVILTFSDTPTADAPAPDGARAPRPHTSSALNGRRILVVDDDLLVSEATSRALSRAGAHVFEATSAQEATSLLGSNPSLVVDVLVVDYRLAGTETGAEVIEQVRRALGRTVPAVMITGDTAADDLKQLRSYQLKVIHKPVSSYELIATVQALLTDAQEQ